MEKEKKVIKVLTAFFISHKSDIKTFLKWILNQCHTALVNMTLYIYIYIPTVCLKQRCIYFMGHANKCL